MAWYSAGTVSVTNGNATVTGSDTAWVANAQASEGIWLPDGRLYEIVSINSDTNLTISPNYLGTTQSGQIYRIVPVKGYPLLAAQQMAALISTVQGYVDGALSGRFGDGTVGAPGVSFAGNTAMGLYRVAANQLGFVTNGVRRMMLSSSSFEVNVPIIGSAVQASGDDTTPGVVLIQGAHGLGLGDRPAPGNDANQCITPGFNYRFSTSGINTPPVPYGGTLQVHKGSGGDRLQQVFLHTNGRDVYTRSSADGGETWTEWTKQLNMSDILGTVSQSGGVPTGKLFEPVTNANGTYLKLPDGTMLAWSPSMSAANVTTALGALYRSASVTWNYPASFAAAPVISGASGDADAWISTGSVGTSGAAVRLISPLSKASPVTFRAMAVGRWF